MLSFLASNGEGANLQHNGSLSGTMGELIQILVLPSFVPFTIDLIPCLSFEWGFSQMKFSRIITGIVLLKAWSPIENTTVSHPSSPIFLLNSHQLFHKIKYTYIVQSCLIASYPGNII